MTPRGGSQGPLCLQTALRAGGKGAWARTAAQEGIRVHLRVELCITGTPLVSVVAAAFRNVCRCLSALCYLSKNLQECLDCAF